MSDWPLASDYAGMLQNSRLAFKDPVLQKCEIKRDGKNQPVPMAGQFAVVFQAILPDGSKRAVRAFTSQRPGITDRYRLISEHLSKTSLPSLVNFLYDEKGIRASVRGKARLYPLVVMDWFPGITLFQWVHERCAGGHNQRLRQAADQWLTLVNELVGARIAHGDLQHNNILVDDRDRLKLVDYDCMCVPALVGQRNLEIGVVPYQHPSRDPNTCLSLSLDNFSAIFIYVALRALAAEPRLWTEFVVQTNYEKLLFREEDFRDPSASNLYGRLRRSPDGDARRLADQLAALYRGQLQDVPPLKDLLFSYDKVRSLLDQKQFDEAVALLDRKKDTSDAPADLKPRIQNARQRVERLRQIRPKVQAGDERGMKELYDAALLEDYPAAAEEAAVARLSGEVIPVLDSLAQARQRQQWRMFAQIWDRHRALLEPRRSARAFRAEVESWRPRNRACELVLRLAAKPECDPDELEQAWAHLQSLGGHPELNAHANHIARLIARGKAWKNLAKLLRQPGPGSEQVDAQVVRDWNESLLKGWEVAEKERPRLAAARGRQQILAHLAAVVERNAALPTAQGEREIVDTAAQLPQGYAFAQRDRVQLAERRLRAAAQVEAAARGPDDLALAEHWRELSALGGQPLVDAATQTRARLAEQRSAAWSAFRTVLDEAAALPSAQTDDRLDQQWNEPLFGGWPLAQQQRPAVEEARRRLKILQELGRRAGSPGPPTPAGEQELLSLAAQLPSRYEHAHRQRVELARQRLEALQRLRELVQSAAEEEPILDAWKTVQGLQAEKLADAACVRRAELAERRLQRWAQLDALFRQADASPGESCEEQLLRLWDETLLRCWPRAEARRARLTQCRQNQATLGELRALIARPLTADNERSIVQVAGRLPLRYEYAERSRVELARRRTAVLDRLREAVRLGTCEQAITQAADELAALGGQAMLDAPAEQRVALARARLPVLQALEALPPTLSADEYDEQIRRLWREDLLRDCSQAQRWQPRHQTACRRRELLRRLESAFAADNQPAIGEIVSDPLLVDYPLPDTWMPRVEKLRGDMKGARRILAAIKNNRREEFYEVFDSGIVRRCHYLFVAHRPILEKWTREEILPLERLRISAAQGRESVSPVSGNTYRVRWVWPETRFAHQCRVGVSPRRLEGARDPDAQRWPEKPVTVDRDKYYKEGCTLFWPGGRHGIVYVWALVDLGFCTLSSPPLELGRIPPAAGPRGRHGW